MMKITLDRESSILLYLLIGDQETLRNTADIAYLLTLNSNWCGAARSNLPSAPIGFGTKACSSSYFTFGHEVIAGK